MKILMTLLCIFLLCLSGNAQRIDKKLISGKWSLFSMSGAGHTLDRDSLNKNIAQVLSSRRAEKPGTVTTEKDSVELATQLKNKFDQLFSTYARFNENGEAAMLLGFDLDEHGKANEQVGTFEWSADNRISVKLGKSKPTTFVIIKLSAKKLIMASEDDKDGVMMKFERL